MKNILRSNPSVSGGTHHGEWRARREGREDGLTQRRKDAKGELAEYGTVVAMNGVRPSASKMLQVLHALHGAFLLRFFLWPLFHHEGHEEHEERKAKMKAEASFRIPFRP
jgi:hypothetical protein